MPAKTQMPGVRQPPDHYTVLWRYMDLPKFVSLLSTKALWLTQLESLTDHYEGGLPASLVKKWIDQWRQDGIDLEMIHDAHFPSYLERKTRYANCWTMATNESEPMWRLYGGDRRGVAVRAFYSTLSMQLPPTCELGVVEYVDYSTLPEDKITISNLPFMKRAEFGLEQEVRAVERHYAFVKDEDRPQRKGPPGSTLTQADFDAMYNQPTGIKVPVDTSVLIEEVVVNPYADQLFFDIVRDIVTAFGLSKPVRWSSLRASTPLQDARTNGPINQGKSKVIFGRVRIPGTTLWTSGPYLKSERPKDDE
jgi:hypothetical protein